MTLSAAPLRLVIFDCDGVLVDSEPVANRVVAEALTQIGWPMTPEEANGHFLGLTFDAMLPIITARVGAPPEGWRPALVQAILRAMGEEATPIAGIEATLRAVTEMGLPWRVASNSSRREMATKFAVTGLAELVGERIHSAQDVARGKPSPELFLAAAAAGGAAPENCVVIEDSLPGIAGAVAAGMPVYGFAPHDDGAALRRAGAMPFHSMADLPNLLRKRLEETRP